LNHRATRHRLTRGCRRRERVASGVTERRKMLPIGSLSPAYNGADGRRKKTLNRWGIRKYESSDNQEKKKGTGGAWTLGGWKRDNVVRIPGIAGREMKP